MKNTALFLLVVLSFIFPASQLISCNSIEGDIGLTDTPYLVNKVSPAIKDSPATKAIRVPVKTSKQDSVLICNSKSAYAYHKSVCSGLKRCKAGISKVTQAEATSQGYRACKICYSY